jgi:hypothetical protein
MPSNICVLSRGRMTAAEENYIFSDAARVSPPREGERERGNLLSRSRARCARNIISLNPTASSRRVEFNLKRAAGKCDFLM